MGGFFVIGRIIALLVWLCIGAVFSTLGGLLGVAFFKKSGPPPGTIDVPSVP
jgi:hypothetical protein